VSEPGSSAGIKNGSPTSATGTDKSNIGAMANNTNGGTSRHAAASRVVRSTRGRDGVRFVHNVAGTEAMS
jgi:hypothetical protein